MKQFLKQLERADKVNSGLFLFRNFTSNQIDDFDTDEFPWNKNPKIFGESLPQHAYLYKRTTKELKASPALQKLETLCQTIETEFDGTISDVFCNRFQDPNHHIPWHKDTYGSHIFVLSFGADRVIEFRDNKTKEIEPLLPHAGDLYFMPLRINETHMHRVLASSENDKLETRVSLVFFFQPPKYAKEYKITTMQRIKGALNGLLEYAQA